MWLFKAKCFFHSGYLALNYMSQSIVTVWPCMKRRKDDLVCLWMPGDCPVDKRICFCFIESGTNFGTEEAKYTEREGGPKESNRPWGNSCRPRFFHVSDSDLGLHIGDTCTASCSSVIKNSFCNTTTNTCQCLSSHPIIIEEVTCVAGKH